MTAPRLLVAVATVLAAATSNSVSPVVAATRCHNVQQRAYICNPAAEGQCEASIGYCSTSGDCTINVGVCEDGGNCLVNVGRCQDARLIGGI